MLRQNGPGFVPQASAPAAPYAGQMPSQEELARIFGGLKGFAPGTSPQEIEKYYRQRLGEVGYYSPQPEVKPGNVQLHGDQPSEDEFNAAVDALHAKYPTWTQPQLFNAATAVIRQRRQADQEAYKQYVPGPAAPARQAPPQDTDPIRKLIEDARQQMDLQDRLEEARKQVQMEALQRQAAKNNERVMYNGNQPFLPSQDPAAAERVRAEQRQKQIADNQAAFAKQQADAARNQQRPQAPGMFRPGMAQPIPPPSQGDPYVPPGQKSPPWGQWIGQPGFQTADFLDTDGDGIDDRKQAGPGKPRAR